MNIRKIVYIFATLLVVSSCYKDKGNYDYRDINEIEIAGIAESYARDMEETLIIKPQITGTQYSDVSRFTYEWEIVNEIVSTDLNLEYVVTTTPGTKICRFIVTDKETNIKAYKRFGLNVSSSTAGDLIMVLSKYQGRAEMSYLRLLNKEEIGMGKEANWAINYYRNRFEEELGNNPQQLAIIYCEAAGCYPFVNEYGRIMVLVDNKLRLINKSSLEPDMSTPYLTGEAYTGISSYPPANIEGYESQFITEGFYIWRSNAYGTGFQLSTHLTEVSGGKMYYAYSLAPSVWSASYYPNVASPYSGYISPFCFWDDMEPTPDNNLTQLGYDLGHLICFDQTYGRFFSSFAYGSPAAISTESIQAFPGYTLKWGSATSLAEKTALSVLSMGNECRLVLIKSTGTGAGAKELVGHVAGGGTMNANSKFYVMKYTNYMFFSSGSKIYRYNLLDISSSVAPSEANMVINLADYGYDAGAVITDICVSRSERTMLVGVSRYGADLEAMGEEAKGDILYFTLDASNLSLTYSAEKSAKGVAGIPVDIEIKYQTHWRDGAYQGEMKDTI